MDEKRPAREGNEAAVHRRHPLLAVGTLVALLIVLLILIWDWNWFKRPIERRVSAATGRTFHIDGDLSVKLAWQPRITKASTRPCSRSCCAVSTRIPRCGPPASTKCGPRSRIAMPP